MSIDPVSLAITVALTAANMAMTASQTIEGPRVSASPGTVADYGTPLNYFRGTRIMACPCFFAKPIDERRTQRKGKGGKQVTYTGYGTWAVSIADHEIGGVLQIWFDNHLVYDASGSGIQTYPLGDGYEIESSLRIYTGSATQEPDPDMQAFIEARDGPGTCPAYRDTAYIYFQGVPLEKIGNRFPDVRVMASQTLPSVGAPEIVHASWDHYGLYGGAAIVDRPLDFAPTTAVEGDLLFVNVSTGASSLVSGALGRNLPGFTLLTEAEADDGDAQIRHELWYKVVGPVPDTEWSADACPESDSYSSFSFILIRGADTGSFIASGPVEVAGTTVDAITLPDLPLAGGSFPCGTVATNAGDTPYLFTLLSVPSASRAQQMVFAFGAKRYRGTGAFPNGGFDENDTTNGAVAGHSITAVTNMVFYSEANALLTGTGTTLGAVLRFVADRQGLAPIEYDFSQADQPLDGYNWTQADGRQICEALTELFDVDLRPHDFKLEALPRGSASVGSLPTDEFAWNEDGPPFVLNDADDLPGRVFLTYADTNSNQEPNVAMPPGSFEPGLAREATIDMTTLAIEPDYAQPLAERWQRRKRFGRWSSAFALTRRRIEIEPGDVWTPSFDGEAMIKRCTKLTIGADGRIETEWTRDDPAIAVLSDSIGGPAAGYKPDVMPVGIGTLGFVIDAPYLVDGHDQSAPLAYVVAGPEETGTWTGADFAFSDTGDADGYAVGWDGVGSSLGAVIGTCTDGLPDVSDHGVPDNGNVLEVTVNAGELTSASLQDLLIDPTLNLAAIESGDGWELVQFTTATLIGPGTYSISGFLRGVRGTEWATGGHAAGDRFVLLETAKIHTLGASEIGDTDYYIPYTVGQSYDPADAIAVAYTGASHKPYAPVHPVVAQPGADWTFSATRRTRIGGNTLDGQDVPLGEASESWELDILDGETVVRTIAGISLPLTYSEADQTTDFGAPLGVAPAARLYQINPTLSLRGYPLAMAE